jgi:hypothetical protein
MFKELFLEAGGKVAGKMELRKTPVEVALEYGIEVFKQQDKDFTKEYPNFINDYNKAQNIANNASTKRKDMPVISSANVKFLQHRLSRGFIDINPPFNPTFKENPFPNGLSGEKAKEWLEAGMPKYDKGKISDDKIKVKIQKTSIENLIPIQEQMYIDKILKNVAQKGTEYLKSSMFIISSDNRILDGHHRWLSGMLLDPKLKVNTLSINLSIDKLLPMLLSYSDAIGNARNK